MKLISWNVNGIRAWKEKPGTLEFLKKEDPDIFCMQEIKAKQEQIEAFTQDKTIPEIDRLFSQFPFHFWNPAERPGYSGTALLTKQKPLRVWYGMESNPLENKEGRIINAEFEDFIVVNVYTPNAKPDLARLPLRYEEWDTAFLAHLKELEEKKPVIVCGDLNVAHEEIDIARPEANRTTATRPGSAGFTNEERERFGDFLQAGFIDTFRALHPEEVRYSWWSYRMRARERNVGWRIDYVLVSQSLFPKVEEAIIYHEVTGSDHAPVGLVLDL